jgi:hypothetical protein
MNLNFGLNIFGQYFYTGSNPAIARYKKIQSS